MIRNNLSLLVLMLTVISLQQLEAQKTSIYWINSIKTECNRGAGKDMCLMIQKSENLDPDKWEHFYADIEGFDYQPGFFQKIEVIEENIPANEVAQDVSSIKFTALRKIEKIEDPIWNIEGNWKVERLLDKKIDKQGQVPGLVINLKEMTVSGSNGCNNYTGSIKFISPETFTTGPIASTRKMCLEMTIPDRFDKLFFMPWNYILEDKQLVIKDKEGQQLMVLKRS